MYICFQAELNSESDPFQERLTALSSPPTHSAIELEWEDIKKRFKLSEAKCEPMENLLKLVGLEDVKREALSMYVGRNWWHHYLIDGDCAIICAS